MLTAGAAAAAQVDPLLLGAGAGRVPKGRALLVGQRPPVGARPVLAQDTDVGQALAEGGPLLGVGQQVPAGVAGLGHRGPFLVAERLPVLPVLADVGQVDAGLVGAGHEGLDGRPAVSGGGVLGLGLGAQDAGAEGEAEQATAEGHQPGRDVTPVRVVRHETSVDAGPEKGGDPT